jgi:hypothetical protein
MELSDIEAYDGVVSLLLRESLEDECHPKHTVSSRSGDQDGHEKCTGAHSSFSHVCFHCPLTDNLLHSISWTP